LADWSNIINFFQQGVLKKINVYKKYFVQDCTTRL